MPKVPRDQEGATPKKRSRKTTPKSGNGVHASNGNGAVTAPVTASPETAGEQRVSTNVEERIRARAYELYLQRGGHGGSPEQDWLRAQEEICGR